MSRMVAFAGGPLPGAFGAHVPIFDGGEKWYTLDGRTIKVDELERYENYITRVTPREVDPEHTLAYRSPHFYLLPIDDQWYTDPLVPGNFVFRTMSRDEYKVIAAENTRLHLEAARRAYEGGAKVKAAILATHGMMTAVWDSPEHVEMMELQDRVVRDPLLASVFRGVLSDIRAGM